jgi:hypothetical protein
MFRLRSHRRLRIEALAEVPGDLRARLERARLDSLVFFRLIDRLGLGPRQLPQAPLRKLMERDADCAEALRALDQPAGTLNHAAMLTDTLAVLEALPAMREAFVAALPPGAAQIMSELRPMVEAATDAAEAYNGLDDQGPGNR